MAIGGQPVNDDDSRDLTADDDGICRMVDAAVAFIHRRQGAGRATRKASAGVIICGRKNSRSKGVFGGMTKYEQAETRRCARLSDCKKRLHVARTAGRVDDAAVVVP